MSNRYEEGRATIQERLVSKGEPKEIYRLGCVNWRGPRKKGAELYSNYFARYLVENFKRLRAIEPIRRIKSYDCRHQGRIDLSNDLTIFTEKRLVRAIFNESKAGSGTGKITDPANCLGRLIDYEVPLKNSNKDLAGDIDLLGIDEARHCFNLTEVKILPVAKEKASAERKSGETLLRALMEISTYFKVLDRDQFVGSFSEKLKTHLYNFGWRLIILSQAGSLSAQQMQNLKRDQPDLFALAQKIAQDVHNPVSFCEYELLGDPSQPRFSMTGPQIFFGRGIEKVVIRNVLEIGAEG